MGLHIASETRQYWQRKTALPAFHLPPSSRASEELRQRPTPRGVKRVLSGWTLALVLTSSSPCLSASDQAAKQKHSKTFAHSVTSPEKLVLAHPEFQVFEQFPAEIKSGNLELTISIDDPHYYTGQPYREKAVGKLYGAAQVKSDQFYGVERIVHYAISKEHARLGSVSVQERVTVLFDNTDRFNPKKPEVLESKPFTLSEEGTFIDRQTLGGYGSAPDVRVVQFLRQEILISGGLAITIYILRTPRDIRLIGYSVPQTIP